MIPGVHNFFHANWNYAALAFREADGPAIACFHQAPQKIGVNNRGCGANPFEDAPGPNARRSYSRHEFCRVGTADPSLGSLNSSPWMLRAVSIGGHSTWLKANIDPPCIRSGRGWRRPRQTCNQPVLGVDGLLASVRDRRARQFRFSVCRPERLLRPFCRSKTPLWLRKRQTDSNAAVSSRCTAEARRYKLYQVKWLARKARWRSLKSAARLAN